MPLGITIQDPEKDFYDAIYAELAEEAKKHNKITSAKNNRIFSALNSMYGKAYVKNLKALLEECEVGSQMGYLDALELVRKPAGHFVSERYGRKIKGYWSQQWATGDGGDTWAGYIYVELKKNLYLKAPFDC